MRRRSPSFTGTKQPRAPNSRLSWRQRTPEYGPLAPHRLQAAEERRTPRSYGQYAAEQNHGVDADAPIPRPVIVGIQIQPESKFVQGQRCTSSIAHRHQSAEENRKRGMAPPKIEQPSVANQQQNQDAPYQVMNVMSPDHHPSKRPMVVDDEAHDQPHARKRKQKRYRGNEHPSSRTIGNSRAYDESQTRELQQDEQQNDHEARKSEQDQSSSPWHRHSSIQSREYKSVPRVRGGGLGFGLVSGLGPTVT